MDSKGKFENHLSGLQHNKVETHDDDESDDSDSDNEDEDVGNCRYCGCIYKTYNQMDDHQSNYIQCEKCNVCFHNEFQCDDHVKCDIF